MKKTVKQNKNNTWLKLVYALAFIAIITTVGFSLFLKFNKQKTTNLPAAGWENKYFSNEDLSKYNGSDPKKPIYMGYEGKVYDVSAGAGFYAAGKTYNYLTGRDATAELNEVGVGEIIVRKYPVVGKLK